VSAAGQVTRTVVLVVDDTPETLGFLTQALERNGYMALVATGGAQALSLVGRISPDLILLDALMPGMDGFETCRQLKRSSVAHVPVIFMTALSETEHIVAGLAAGGVDYVTKPIVLDELFARIRVHVANARAAESTRIALDQSGSSLVALDAKGALLWSTPQALALLDGLLTDGAEGRLLVDSVRQQLRLGEASSETATVVADGTRGPIAFALVSAGGAGERLIRVSRHDPRSDKDVLAARLSLTAREAEVLLWLAKGKANRDIADILALSPRTVNKHLETIFAKLGVENRASAAVIATRALDER
jgi:DNA-binding response OmpR family regulator/DNA-binding CsgD family transcriptional regulator